MSLTKELAQKKLDDGKSMTRTDPKGFVAKHYHEKAKVLANHFEPFVGHAAIEKYYVERNKLDPKGEYDMCFHVDETAEAGDMGIVEGRYELKKVADKTCLDHGKFLTILKKVNNDWTIFRVMSNTNKPRQL